ncbi:hypothetical protein PENSPDRAFT_232148 [Peniophora sp. CONT]|nr:hypothetical protein PENSPDRAFT_232148 [Peniophora sp. CONT]
MGNKLLLVHCWAYRPIEQGVPAFMYAIYDRSIPLLPCWAMCTLYTIYLFFALFPLPSEPLF